MRSRLGRLADIINLIVLVFVFGSSWALWGEEFSGFYAIALIFFTIVFVFLAGAVTGSIVVEKEGYFLVGRSNLYRSRIYHRKAPSINLHAQGFEPRPADVCEDRKWLTLIECPDGSTRYCLFEEEPPEHFVILPGNRRFVPVFGSFPKLKDEVPSPIVSPSPSTIV